MFEGGVTGGEAAGLTVAVEDQAEMGAGDTKGFGGGGDGEFLGLHRFDRLRFLL